MSTSLFKPHLVQTNSNIVLARQQCKNVAFANENSDRCPIQMETPRLRCYEVQCCIPVKILIYNHHIFKYIMLLCSFDTKSGYNIDIYTIMKLFHSLLDANNVLTDYSGVTNRDQWLS